VPKLVAAAALLLWRRSKSLLSFCLFLFERVLDSGRLATLLVQAMDLAKVVLKCRTVVGHVLFLSRSFSCRSVTVPLSRRRRWIDQILAVVGLRLDCA